MGEKIKNWFPFTLKDVCTIKYGKDHKKLNDGDVPCMGSGGVMRYVDTPIYNKPSVLIPRKGTLSNLFYMDTPFWSVDTLFYTHIDDTKVLPKYLFYNLETQNLEKHRTGTGVPSLTTEVLNRIELKLPPPPRRTETHFCGVVGVG